MTSIVAVACVDGIVVGADSAASFGLGPGRPNTIEQTVDKIYVVGDQIIIAGTGQVGLCQRFVEATGRLYASNGFRDCKSASDAGKILSKTAINDFAETAAPKGQFGAVTAIVVRDTPHLIELAVADLQPEVKDRIWYVSMGSAQPITDPFLGFLRDVFWKDGRPRLADATFCVTWALDQAVKLNPGGVNEPIRVAVLGRDQKQKWHARCLDEGELAAHRQNIEEAKAHLRAFPARQQPEAAADLPSVPTR